MTGAAGGLMAGEKIFEEQRLEEREGRLLDRQHGYTMSLEQYRATKQAELEASRQAFEEGIAKLKIAGDKEVAEIGASGRGREQGLASQGDIDSIVTGVRDEIQGIFDDVEDLQFTQPKEELMEGFEDMADMDADTKAYMLQNVPKTQWEPVSPGVMHSRLTEDMEQSYNDAMSIGKTEEADEIRTYLDQILRAWNFMNQSGGIQQAGAASAGRELYTKAARKYKSVRKEIRGG